MRNEITVKEVVLHWKLELVRIQYLTERAKISETELPCYFENDEQMILKTLELLGDCNEQTANP